MKRAPRPRMVVSLGLGLWCVVAPTSLWAQASDTVDITAHIVDARTGDPLYGAVLALSGIQSRYVTDARGEVTFPVALGEYVMVIRRGGYETLQGDFDVLRPGDFRLGLDPEELDDPAAQGRIVGTVTDAELDRPVEGARVTLLGHGDAVTDDRGRFQFPALPAGLAEIRIQMLGYAERTDPVTVHSGRTTAVEVGMSVEAVALEPIHVEVRSPVLETNGVYERMEQGLSGHILTRSDIEARGAYRLSDHLDAMAGVRVLPSGQRRVATGRANCPLAIYVDGVEWGVDIEGTVDIDRIPTEWIEVAEVYTGIASAPVEYSRDGRGCGVMLIWTRQGFR